MKEVKLKVEYLDISALKPYEGNAKEHPEEQVENIMESIKEFGMNDPIGIWGEENVIVEGHGRLMACQRLGIEMVPVIRLDDLDDEQRRAYALAHNQTTMTSGWNEEMLDKELGEILNIDMTLFGFENAADDFADEIIDNTYTMKTSIPQYQINGECPSISEMLDTEKSDELLKEISEAEGITEEEREFLVQAARRHNVFNYRNIAEYYAHATPEMQRLMEKSALVIIDFDDAIANGYANLFGDVLKIMGGVRMMRDDFAVFILTHGRADNVETMKALKKGGYTGKWYMILDNEDDTEDKYRENFGDDHIIVFDKQKAYENTDTMDNFNEHRAIIYARNESFRIAKELGLKYFLMLDDDYKEIDYRYEEGKKLAAKPAKEMDRLFEDMIQFLDVSGAATVAFAQGGDFVGGLEGGNFKKRLLRKAMNSLFCKTDNPINFRGTMNEDVTTYTTLGSRGRLFFTLCDMCVIQIPTQSLDGGMTESYLESGTYVKTFYSVMAMPSCIKVGMMYSKHRRIHHRINWECCVPKIINERYRKRGKESCQT